MVSIVGQNGVFILHVYFCENPIFMRKEEGDSGAYREEK